MTSAEFVLSVALLLQFVGLDLNVEHVLYILVSSLGFFSLLNHTLGGLDGPLGQWIRHKFIFSLLLLSLKSLLDLAAPELSILTLGLFSGHLLALLLLIKLSDLCVELFSLTYKVADFGG